MKQKKLVFPNSTFDSFYWGVPLHLHGHDFYVLGAQENSVYTNALSGQLNFENPPRRDTAMLPAGGWLVLAFETNNPGAWIMHVRAYVSPLSFLAVLANSMPSVILPGMWQTV